MWNKKRAADDTQDIDAVGEIKIARQMAHIISPKGWLFDLRANPGRC
jgi:hypothetical protein